MELLLHWHWLLAFLALGAVVGIAAGLLGIGGGGIMVPVLTAVFFKMDFPAEQVVHLALGTAMASIVPTAFGSMRAHHARAAVDWTIVRMITPAILVGTFAATFLVAHLSTLILAVFFAIFMAYVSIQMVLNITPSPQRSLPGFWGMSIAGSSIGGVSALVAIGGGSLSVPFMMWCNVDIRRAIATSAAIGFPIAVAGSLGYLVNGWRQPGLPDYTIGYVFWPAFLMITPASYFFTRIGAKLAHTLPLLTLKRVFAVLLMGLSLKMLHSVLA